MWGTLSALVALAVQDDRPRVRETLPNGVTVLAVSKPGAEEAVVTVLASSRGFGDLPQSHGVRHLLEHIVAKGPKKDADRRLESEGVLLEAQTTREGLWLTTRGPGSKLALAVEVLKEIVLEVRTTEEELAREMEILRQEKVGLPGYWGFDAEAWVMGFGPEAVDPFGDLETMAGMGPEALAAAGRSVFEGGNVTVVALGDLSAATTAVRLREAFGGLRRSTTEPGAKRESIAGQGMKRISARGSSRSAVVSGLGSSETVAVIGAAMALAGRIGGQVLYTPSYQPGLVTIWTPSGFGIDEIDDFSPAQLTSWTQEARVGANAWFWGTTGSLTGEAQTEALMLASGAPTPLSVLASYPAGATDAEIMQGFARFFRGNALEVRGR